MYMGPVFHVCLSCLSVRFDNTLVRYVIHRTSDSRSTCLCRTRYLWSRITIGTGLDTTCPTVILYQPLDTLYHITVGHDVSRYETMYPVVESSCPRSIRKVKPLDTGHDVMEVLYYFICSVSYARARNETLVPGT